MKYACVTKNYSMGRVWEEGMVVEMQEDEEQPNHHFAPIADEYVGAITIGGIKRNDVMSVKKSNVADVMALSQIRNSTPKVNAGFAAGLSEETIEPKQFKQRVTPRKAVVNAK